MRSVTFWLKRLFPALESIDTVYSEDNSDGAMRILLANALCPQKYSDQGRRHMYDTSRGASRTGWGSADASQPFPGKYHYD